MTKVDARLFSYVPCSDLIEVNKKSENEGGKDPVSTKCGDPCCKDGGSHISALPNGTCHLNKSDSGHETASSRSSSSGDSFFNKNQERNEAEKGESVDNCDNCIRCKELRQSLNESMDESVSSEKSLLQTKCNLHYEQTQREAQERRQPEQPSQKKFSLCINDNEDSNFSACIKGTPLSNFDNRKRNASGGSVIQHIQLAIEKEEEKVKKACRSCDCQWKLPIAMFTLLFANLINYMDRYTIAGVLLDIQDYYNMSNADAGLLQTSFIVFYMLFSPLFGYLGDRWNRKILMALGIFFWSLITLAGSFIPQDKFWLFLLMRAMVGVGEASYSTIAPTIIADLFIGDNRSKALSLFYFAIPVGSGLGYIVGAKVAAAMGGWQWALRVTPGLGVICTLLILLFVEEPPRGQAEGGASIHRTSWSQDIKYLMKNKSFILSTGGFTCVSFVAGALALWAPAYIDYSIRISNQPKSHVSLYFGIITCAAGFLGVGLGSESARRLRKSNPRADPLVCAFGLIMCAPFLFLVMFLSRYSIITAWVLIFIGEVFLCLNWAVVTDILLYIVIPTRRSSAEAVQILISHAFGDAGSPYILGAVSDYIRADNNSTFEMYLSLQYALYMTCFVAVIGGGFFLANAMYIEKDKARADKVINGALQMQSKATMREMNSTPITVVEELSTEYASQKDTQIV